MNKKWIVNSYKNDVSWISDYTDNYIIYDKSGELPETDKILHQKNVGLSGYDFCCFIIDNYDNLPDICVFMKDNIFTRNPPHCNKEKFDTLIKNNFFTTLESQEHLPESYAHIKDVDGGYMEINNSWYVKSHINTYGKDVAKYFYDYNIFMSFMFIGYESPKYVRFAPGGNYIVPKENLLFYSIDFWKKLKLYQSHHINPVEAHIIERALFYIFTNRWKEKQ